MTFKLLAIELPTGAGRVNRIITAESKRSIIQVGNDDTICLARAVVVGACGELPRHSSNNIQKQADK